MLEDSEIVHLLQRVANIDEVEVFVEASDREVMDFVADLNREQLMEGKNANGELLSEIGGEYSDTTMDLAAEKGRPKKGKSHVDLLDEGNYHKSIEADVDRQGYNFTSDPIKEDFHKRGDNSFLSEYGGKRIDLSQRYGDEITGLNEQKVDKLVNEKLADKYVGYLEKNIIQI